MAEYTYGKGFAIRTETDCIATENDFGQYVGRITAVKIITNADRIRAMTDEELAKWISSRKETCPPIKAWKCSFKSCHECWLEWLRKNATSD